MEERHCADDCPLPLLSQITLIVAPGDIEAAITDSLSMPFSEFITKFIGDLLSGGEVVPGSSDLSHFCGMAGTRSPSFKAALAFLRDNPEHGCNKILVMYFKRLSAMAAEIFPKTAAKILDVELSVGVGVERHKEDRIKEWMELHSSIDYGSLTRLADSFFGRLGMYVFNVLFAVWSLLLVDNERPEVEIVTSDLVHKRSLPVLYYVAGWTLQRASLSKTVALSDRQINQSFATLHSIGRESAKEADLPISLVELRQKKCLFFASKSYFLFIKTIESVYVKNLTLKMMMAYVDGDLVEAINAALLASEIIRDEIFALFETEPSRKGRRTGPALAVHGWSKR